MAFAADQVRLTSQYSARTGSIIRFVWHHMAGVDDESVIRAVQAGTRNLSMTWAVGNKPPVGAALRDWAQITSVVPEQFRPWTSDSQLVDGRALTVECANSSGGPEWGISDASFEACARLAAYAYEAYGVPLKRIAPGSDGAGHIGHGEIPGVWPGEGYATFCPGNLDIDRILTRARQLVGNGLSGGALSEEDDVTPEELAAGLAVLRGQLSAEIQAAVATLALESSFGRPAAMFYAQDVSTVALCWPGGSVILTNGADIGYYMGKGVAGAPRPVSSMAELASIQALYAGMGDSGTDTQRILDAIKANPGTGDGGPTVRQILAGMGAALTEGAK